MKDLIKPSVGIFSRNFVVTVINIFMCMSMLLVATVAFTKVDGYVAAVYKEGADTPFVQYTYKYSEGEDTKKADYEKKGYTVATSATRDEMTKTENIIFYSVTEIFALVLLMGFIYPNMYSCGSADSNLVRFRHKKKNLANGFIIGFLGMVPSVLLMLLCLTVGRNVVNVKLLSILFANFYSFIQLAGGSAGMLKELSAVQSILMFVPMLIVPITAGIGYIMGFKGISAGEKLIYKKQDK